MRRLYPQAGRAHLVGITGPPGSGKSTLVAALIERVRAAGRSVGVVAVDPSSPITGGALLGDRVRMQAYAGDGDVFIRSMASRGHAGGLASTSTAAAAVMDASGFDLILIETVGTGQSEVEVAAAADTTVVLEAPEMGDEVQAIKAGLLEVADLVVVNKGDRPGALRTASQLRAMLVAGASPKVGAGEGNERPRPKRPEVLVTTASTGEGVDELLVALDRHRAAGRDAASGGAAGKARLARAEAQVWAILSDRLRDALREVPHDDATRATLAEVAEHRLDPYTAADRLLEALGVDHTMTAAGERLVTRPFVVLVAAGLAFFTAGGAVLPVASQFAEGPLDATTLGVGIAIGAFAIGSLLLRPVVGWGSDRFGRRPMLLLGTLLSIAGLGAPPVRRHAADARAGAGHPGRRGGLLLRCAAGSRERPRTGGSTRGGVQLRVARPLHRSRTRAADRRDRAGLSPASTSVWIVCIALTAVATVLSLLVPETAPAVLAAASGQTERVRARLFHPAGVFPGVVVLLGTWGMAGYFAFVPLHAKQIGMSGSALPLTVYAVLVVILRVAFAKLPDQMGAARLSGAALVVASVGLAIVGLVPTAFGLVAGSAVFALGMAFVMPALLTLAVSRVQDTERGAVVGTTSLFLDLSFGLSPAFLGAVAASAGYAGAFLVSAAAAGCGALLIALRRHDLARPVAVGAATLDG